MVVSTLSAPLAVTLAAGAASLVEFIEALTMVLAVGATRGWRSALCGAAAALALLLVLVALFGPALRQVPLRPAQGVVGVLLVLFGTRWLRKATRRAAGLQSLRDERAAFLRHSDRLSRQGVPSGRWDAIGLAASFQATAIEGLEVVFIVVAMGAGGPGLLAAAAAGAALALGLVLCLGLLLHRPITRVPENTLKRLVAAMLTGFGTFWIGEAAGLSWPGGDLAVPGLMLAYLLLSVGLAARLRTNRPRSAAGTAAP